VEIGPSVPKYKPPGKVNFHQTNAAYIHSDGMFGVFHVFFPIYTYIPIQGSLWNNLGYIVSATARGHTNHGDKHVSASRIGTDTATSLAIESFEPKKEPPDIPLCAMAKKN